MNKFTSKSCDIIRDNINSNLKELGEKLGVGLRVGGGSYVPDEIVFKLHVSPMNSDGKIVDIREADWNKHYELFGMKQEWLGKTFRSASGIHTIKGLDVRKRKYPVITEYRGLEYKHTVINVKSFMRG